MTFLRVFHELGGRIPGFALRGGDAQAPGPAGLATRTGLLAKLALPVIVIAIQALVATASLQTLSVLRVFAESESDWSKAQKTAVNSLNRYADRGDEQDYQRFVTALATDFRLNAVRQALEKPEPDVEAATALLKQADIHSDDIPGVIFFLVHFRDHGYFRPAISLWRESDALLAELAALGETIHARVVRGENPARDAALIGHLRDFDARLSTMATGFSKSLGAGARAVTRRLALANIGLALVLIGLIVWRVRALFRRSQAFENALLSEKEQAQVTLKSIADGVIRVDAEARVEYVNPAAERLIGLDRANSQGRPLAHLITIVDGSANPVPWDEGEAHYDPSRELTLVTTAGATPVSMHREALQAEGETRGAVLVLRDMTRERDLIDRLSQQARQDELTGLANRRELNRRLRLAIEAAEETAFMQLDLDQFKLVNDTCGHAAGDQLLREVATMLTRAVGDAGLAARLGGDEFAALLAGCDVVRAMDIAEGLREAIQDFIFVWDGRAFRIGASIGLVPGVHACAEGEDVFRAADVACYIAKEKGRNRVQLHEPSGDEVLRRVTEMGWAHKIRAALDNGHFCLHAQPIAPLQGEATGAHFELLVRMHDEQGELVSPGRFMPAAERYVLMPRIDRFVVDAAFTILAAVADDAGALSFAINLSGQSISDPTFVDFVRSRFEAHGVAPSSVSFEITETIAIANLGAATTFIETFRAAGCKFLLDDFGAGMSSFGYLKRLPVDYLKIDGGFVKDMLRDPVDHAMVDMIARMARTLGIGTIAEFAETDEIVEALRELGVDHAQGYAIGRPFPICKAFGLSNLRCRSSRCKSHDRIDEEARCA